MSSTKTKYKEYQVQAVIKNIVPISVTAASLDDAMEKAKGLDESHFVEIQGDNIDGSFRISGVYESDLD